MTQGKIQSITNLEGATYRVGARVRHTDGWLGTIREIKGDRLKVDPDDLGQVRYGVWKLNPEAAKWHGRPDFCVARDNGQSMGNFKPE